MSATTQNLEYREIERDLREQYAIKYQITDAARVNEWRDVKVVVKEKDVVARTIRGYFTPETSRSEQRRTSSPSLPLPPVEAATRSNIQRA